MSEQPINQATETPEKAPATKTKEIAPKPLSVTQRRDLGKLVDNNFEALKGELRVFANQLKIERERVINEEYAEREQQARQIEQDWRTFVAGLRTQCDEWIRARRDDGWTVEVSTRQSYDRQPSYAFGNIQVTVPEKERAIKEVDNFVEHQRMAALQALERQRLGLQQDILLDGLVSDKAREFLNRMPDPRSVLADIMTNAQRAGLTLTPVREVQQIEGGVDVHHAHDDARIVIGVIEDPD